MEGVKVVRRANREPQVTVRINETLLELLRKTAEKYGLTVSEFIRFAIVRELVRSTD